MDPFRGSERTESQQQRAGDETHQTQTGEALLTCWGQIYHQAAAILLPQKQ